MRQVLSQLSLTDIQKQDIKQIVQGSREDRGLFKADAKSQRLALRSLIQATQWDNEAAESAILQQQGLKLENALKRATDKNQIWNLLTQEQQVEFVTQLETQKAKRIAERSKHEKKRLKFGKKFDKMDLNEEQVSAIEAIKATAKASIQATREQLKTFKTAEQTLIQNADFDANAWQTLNNEYQNVRLNMAMIKAKSKHDIWNLLTPEQQAEMPAKNNRSKKGHKRKIG
jgi:Spy/CpxP family protein refolding chaperone